MMNIILHQNEHSTAEHAKLLGPLLARSHFFSPESAFATPLRVKDIQENFRALRGPKGRQHLDGVKKVFERAIIRNQIQENVYPEYSIEMSEQYLASPKKPRLIVVEECSDAEAKKLSAGYDQETKISKEAMGDWVSGNLHGAKEKLFTAMSLANQLDNQRETLIAKRVQETALHRQNSIEASTWLLCLGSGHYRMADRLSEIPSGLICVEHDLVLPHELIGYELIRRRLPKNKDLATKVSTDAINHLMLEGIVTQFVDPNESRAAIIYATSINLAALTPQQRSTLASEIKSISLREEGRKRLSDYGLIVPTPEAKAIFKENYGLKKFELAEDGSIYVATKTDFAVGDLARHTKVA